MSSDNSALASASQFMSVSCHLTQSTVFNKAKDTSWLTILPLPFENILYNTPNASSMYIWHLVLCTSSFTSTFIFKASLEKSDTCWMSEHNFTSPKTHQYCISHTSWNQLKKWYSEVNCSTLRFHSSWITHDMWNTFWEIIFSKMTLNVIINNKMTSEACHDTNNKKTMKSAMFNISSQNNNDDWRCTCLTPGMYVRAMSIRAGVCIMYKQPLWTSWWKNQC